MKRTVVLALLAVAILSAPTREASSPEALPAVLVMSDRMFRFELDAGAVLRSLWEESIGANEERVACIGGYDDRDGFHITRAVRAGFDMADSLHVSHGLSIEQCGPPEWAGTAHTHIALSPWGELYMTFSPSDRAVMNLWRMKWKTLGAFCVLYSEDEAYCEYGTALSGDASYADQRGNLILR